MGVITIAPRTEKLGNISTGGPRRVNISSRHIGSGAAETWRGVTNLGQGVMNLGRDMAHVAGVMMREKRMIEDAENEAEFEKMVRERMTADQTGLMARAGMAGNSGELTQTVDEARSFFKSSAGEFLDEKGYKGDAKRKMALRLASVTRPYEMSFSKTVLGKTGEFRVASADRLFQEKQASWQLNRTDAAATAELIDTFRASQRVRGLSDDEVNTNTDKIMRSLASDYVIGFIKSSNRAELDRQEAELAKGKDGDLLAWNGVLSEYFGGKDAFSPEMKEALQAAIEKRRRQLDRADQDTVDAVLNEGIVAASVVRDANGKYPADRLARIEAAQDKASSLAKTMPKGSAAAANAAAGAASLDKKADQVASEEIMDEYLEMLRRDPQARIFDAKGEGRGEYNAYKGTGRKERLAQEVQKTVDEERTKAAKESRQQIAEFRRANENELKGRMARLMFLEADGSIDPNEAATEQADIWRTLGLYTVSETVTPDFALSFRTSFLKRVDEQEKAAILDLYREFGYNGETGSNGLAPASVQKKDDTSYYVPQAEGADEDDRIKVKASEMYDYVQQMLHTLRALPPDVDRKEAAKAVVRECKTNWIKSGWFDSTIEQNKQSGMRAIMDYQREAQTARAVSEAKRGEDKDDAKTEKTEEE